jgi:hypothetical protein
MEESARYVAAAMAAPAKARQLTTRSLRAHHAAVEEHARLMSAEGWWRAACKQEPDAASWASRVALRALGRCSLVLVVAPHEGARYRSFVTLAAGLHASKGQPRQVLVTDSVARYAAAAPMMQDGVLDARGLTGADVALVARSARANEELVVHVECGQTFALATLLLFAGAPRYARSVRYVLWLSSEVAGEAGAAYARWPVFDRITLRAPSLGEQEVAEAVEGGAQQ